MSFTTFVDVARDIIVSGAAGFTAYFAWKGLSAWKSELEGKASFEAARMLAKATYRLRNAISYCRSPFISSHEFPEEYPGLPTTATSQQEGQAYAHIYGNRWQPVGAAVQEFEAALLEAEALWGKEIKAKGEVLRKCVIELQVDIDCLIQDKFTGGENFRDKAFAQRVRATVNATRGEDNAFTTKINDAVEGIETELRPYLSRA